MSIANRHSASGPAPRRYPHRLVRVLMLLRRLLSAVGLGQNPLPPHFSERMYRDIGIAPPPKTSAWPWPWVDPRA